MSISKGNQFFKIGKYEEALAAYALVPPTSPLYQHAVSNSARIKRLKNTRTGVSSTDNSSVPVIKAIGSAITPAIKGIAQGEALIFSLSGVLPQIYYRLTILTECNKSIVLSVRDSARNLPLYQSAPVDVRKVEHIFFTPPSLVGPIQICLHFNDGKVPQEVVSDNFLINVEIVCDSSTPFFKPKNLKKPVIASIATIESRLAIAIDAAYSLLAQVDRIHVHVNDMTRVPTALDNPRIIVTTKITHGDLGDAGKFVGAQQEDDAYILVADDDFIFPYDFIQQSYLNLALHAHQVIVGMHGIFLRFPMEDYYAEDARNTMHITTGFSFECTSSAVGTGAIFFDSKVFPTKNFSCDYKNMADIWFAIECNRREIPIFIQNRHTNWIIDNPPPSSASVIWKHSTTDIQSAANTRAMQTYVLAAERNFISSLPLPRNSIAKDYVLALDAVTFEKWISTFSTVSKSKYSPALIVVYGAIDIPHLRRISRPIYSDVVFLSNFLCIDKAVSQFCINGLSFFLSIEGLELSVEKFEKLLDLVRSNRDLLTTKVNFSIFAEKKDETGSIFFAPATTGAVQWPSKLDARLLAPLSNKLVKTFTRTEKAQVELLASSMGAKLLPKVSSKVTTRFADYFDHIYLLNMDRRPDRLKEFSERAASWGIRFTRVSAVDGSTPTNKAAYESHQAKLRDQYGSLAHQFKYESSSYWEYTSESERISHLLKRNGKTYSAGGYGYLRTYRNIIEDAIKNQYNRIAVFDDDCLFHNDLDNLFSKILTDLPEDWVTLSLGTLQYDWRDRYVNWASSYLYRCGGFSVGSHAQAYSRFAFPMLLEYIDRYSLPFDVGPLHYLKRYYSTKSFSVYPNLFIQDVGDTDIGDSAVQLTEGAKMNNIYRWNLKNYE